MKKIFLAALALAIFLFGCVAAPVDAPEIAGSQISASSTPVLDSESGDYRERTLRETVQAYFERQYEAYLSLENPGFADVLDMTATANRNAVMWLETLLMRRRLISEKRYCYVETQRFPYVIRYIDDDELLDERVSLWKGRTEGVMVHFVITGEAGKAYPPGFAVNAQHSMWLKKFDDGWKIIFHYYPGSARRYLRGTLSPPDEDKMRESLKQEFTSLVTFEPAPLKPAGSRGYSGAQAARYADTYTESANSEFYDIGDWMGNCANFISQCVWHGFGGGSVAERENMLELWYAGNGGGAPAWENVDAFWRFATGSNGMTCQTLKSARQLKAGDVVQVRTGQAWEEEETPKFNHSLIVVDSATLKLAQNSPDCFVYYSDLANVQARMLRPLYMRKQ